MEYSKNKIDKTKEGAATKVVSKIEQNKGKAFYTKCGIKFYKSSTASVTGYECSNDENCNKCPFKERVERQKNGKALEIFECRAGELEPNSANSYSTSSKDNYTNLSVRSIHWDWIESIRKYVDSVESVTSAYYTQDLPDCRKVLTISFTQNKKGIAAKQSLIDKYFKS